MSTRLGDLSCLTLEYEENKAMNSCDHDHQTTYETRLLPYAKDGNLIVCRRHYDQEMAYRRGRAVDTGIDKWDFPSWDSLDVYSPACVLR